MESRHTVALAVAALAAGCAFLYVATRNDNHADAPKGDRPSAATSASSRPAPPPVPMATMPAPNESTFDPPIDPPPEVVVLDVDAANQGLHATDPNVQRQAIESVIARKDVSALPAIEALDITKDGYVAAAAMKALGEVGAVADAPAKKGAVDTLARWMKQEEGRTEVDRAARGNVGIAIDNLGATKSNDAVAPLVDALDSAKMPVHLETRIVEVLGDLGVASAIPSIERFLVRVRARRSNDTFEQQLIAEAIAMGERTIAKLRGS